jgi:molybdopterin-containing oxidoreductase family iron-sulfur binding subunit
MTGEQWAMTIDMAICTGCSACVVACQAENNILVVGKPEVLNSREMHWLRIDAYQHGDPEDPRVVHQPMLCQHCEKAPCEYVCPVNATVHSSDGLNEMVYNRCVGTRFCSNNCPYKVRRFNWFDWNDRGRVELQRNPDVTVRQRGVMEKCSYCVQRIREVEIHARVEDRAIRPGEVVTACQQACPTQAIQFGSLGHAATDMVRWREEPRSFAVLHDLGTRPRTMYLARIDNPNPEIE